MQRLPYGLAERIPYSHVDGGMREGEQAFTGLHLIRGDRGSDPLVSEDVLTHDEPGERVYSASRDADSRDCREAAAVRSSGNHE